MDLLFENSKWLRRTAALVLLLFIVWGMIIVLLSPYRHFPDEQNHVQYIRHIQLHQELPKFSDETGMAPSSVAFHPPLYYLCAALVVNPSWDFQIQITILRIFSLLQGAVALWILFRCATLVFPGNAAAVILTMAFVGFNPQFIFIHSGIGNIPTTTLTCSVAALFIIKIITAKRITAALTILLGLFLGLSILSRSVAVYMVVPSLIALLYYARDKKEFILHAAMMFACAALTGGWWYIRNWILYDDPLLWKAGILTMGVHFVRKEPVLQWEFLVGTISFLHASFWAYFGRNEYHAGIWEYAVYLLLQAVACAGVFEIWRKRRMDAAFERSAFERTAFFVMVFAGFLAVLEILLILMRLESPQGRYLYMAIVPLGLGLGGGLAKIAPSPYRIQAAYVCSLFLFVFGSYLLIRYWLPHV